MEPMLQSVYAFAVADAWCLCQPDTGIGRLLYWLVGLGVPLGIIVVGAVWSARRLSRQQAEQEERHEEALL